jgi:hypothetical protein
MGLLQDLEAAIHPIRDALAKAEVQAKADAAVLSADVKSAAAAAIAELEASVLPALEADAKDAALAAAKAVEAAVTAYLESKGL